MKHPDLVWEGSRADGRVVSCLLESRGSTHTVVQYVNQVVSTIEEFGDVEEARDRVRALYADFNNARRDEAGQNSGSACPKSAHIFKGWCSRTPPARRWCPGRRRKRRASRSMALSESSALALSALEVIRIGTWETYFTTGVTTWSVEQAQLHGLLPGEFKGTFDAFIDAIEPDHQQRVRDTIAVAHRDGGDVHVEYRVTWSDGSRHWIANVGRTLQGPDGQPAKAVGIGLDITAQKLVEAQSHQVPRLEAIGRLAGGIAHDFNNQLTAIIGYSQFLLDRLSDQAEVASDIEEIKRAGERASRLTSQLLAFGRKQPMAPRILDLNHVVGDLERMLHRIIGEDIVLDLTMGSVGRTNVDPSQVEQVLMNLVVNSRDAMPRGGTLTVRTADVVLDAAFVRQHVGAVAGRYVSLSVRDSGCGIRPEVLARVFEPFFTTKPVGKGSGLGLSTVYGIVKQNGGYVTVDSTVGAGTTFTIYWPQVDGPLESVSSACVPVRTLRGAETVLLVEDEAGVRRLVRRMLEGYGYQVLSAQHAGEAMELEERREGPLHLLLTDIVMPGLSGPDLAQRLVRRRPSMEVLYISGFPHHVALGLGSISSHASILQKPFTPDALAARVRDCLDRRGQSRVERAVGVL